MPSNNPVVKDAWEASLEHGKKLTLAAKFLDSYVESVYQISEQVCSWARINQQSANAEQYLKAVGSLKKKMEQAVAKLKKLEKNKKPKKKRKTRP